MDFFSRQERSRRVTRYLLVLFCLAFLGVGLAAALAVAIVLNFLPDPGTPILSTTLAQPGIGTLRPLLAVMFGTILVMVLASLYRAASLSQGGGQVARMLGATAIASDTREPLHRRLVNVVEEMAIASGLPVPEVYVLEQEPAINAFAAGLSHSDAAVAVTQGALERLDRAELQGVIAHEFSHILNGDMRLNQKLVGYSFGILMLSLLGRWLLRASRLGYRSRNRGMSVGLILGLALTVIGAIGILFGRLIKAAVSRQREMLADASAVQFTREPSALAGALKKIGGYTTHLSTVDSEEVAHMLFGQGARSFRGLFATHPPIEERIKALEPSFDAARYAAEARGVGSATDSEAVRGLAAAAATNDAVLESTGKLEPAAVGATLRSAIPEELYAAAHSRESCWLLVLAMTLSPSPDVAERQQALLRQRLGTDRARRSAELHRELQQSDRRLRLPLLELAIPALRQRPDEQVHFLFDLLNELLVIDPEYRLFDFVLPRILDAYLRGRAGTHLASADKRGRISAANAINDLLACVAVLGPDDRAAAAKAYLAGLKAIRARRPLAPMHNLEARDGDFGLEMLDAAIDRLAKLAPRIKREVLRAVLVTIRHDETIEVEEIELFRAIAAALDCPVPPIAAAAA